MLQCLTSCMKRKNAPKKGKMSGGWGSPSKSKSKGGDLPVAIYAVAAVLILLGAGFYFSEEATPTADVPSSPSSRSLDETEAQVGLFHRLIP